MSNQTKYETFRQTYPEFVYESYRYDVQPDGLHIVFNFRISEYLFQPTAFIPARPFLKFEQPKEIMDRLVFNIGMIELVSYWKCACPPKVSVCCGTLSDEQIRFWEKTYFNGLGEFFYTNGISAGPDDFMDVSMRECGNVGMRECGNVGMREYVNVSMRECGNEGMREYIVPIGGGKDSVVSLSLLKGESTPLIMNPRGATIGCIEAAGLSMDDVIVIHRSIDPLLLELNSCEFLNGHTPFSAMLAFYCLLASQLSGISNIALSNEGSANESTVIGMAVNHQYSKSLEFEDDFRAYVRESLSPSYNYFSLLRPLSELQIAMLFSRLDQYHGVFRSCNVGSKQDVWCGHCAKCLFAYIILSPFISPERLTAIFGKNMLNDDSMRHEFLQLTGEAETKPFECVGTVNEVVTALAMTIDRWYPDTSTRPWLLEGFTPHPPYVPLDTLSSDHNVPPELLKRLSEWVSILAPFFTNC